MGPTKLYDQFFYRSDVEEDEESSKAAAKAKDLLNCFRGSHGKARKGSVAIDRLMLDFFREGCWRGEEKLLGAASSWMRRDGGTGLGVEENKEAYVEGMEESGRWRGFALEEDELVLEIEAWLLVSLLEELMLDLL
ncbi:hypothetical protein ACLOJK_005161 [Asimina triloba]